MMLVFAPFGGGRGVFHVELAQRSSGEIAQKRVIRLRDLYDVKSRLRAGRLHSVCEEARCPNRGECFERRVATFLIGGSVCTRACRFCSIATGRPAELDVREPLEVANAAAELGLRHVVVTAVNRDDLPDGGAAHFAATIRALRERLPAVTVEVLTPDFRGDLKAVDTVSDAGPDVFNHNVETVPRLYRKVRPGARYERSLDVLRRAVERLPGRLIKSGLMVGHGESVEELATVFSDLASVGVNAVTLGQYYQPTADQLPVSEDVPDERYPELEAAAKAAGIAHVWAGRYVRSSYLADRFLDAASDGLPESTIRHG